MRGEIIKILKYYNFGQMKSMPFQIYILIIFNENNVGTMEFSSLLQVSCFVEKRSISSYECKNKSWKKKSHTLRRSWRLLFIRENWLKHVCHCRTSACLNVMIKPISTNTRQEVHGSGDFFPPASSFIHTITIQTVERKAMTLKRDENTTIKAASSIV